MTYGYNNILNGLSPSSGSPALWAQTFPYNTYGVHSNSIYLGYNDISTSSANAMGVNVIGNPHLSVSEKNNMLSGIFQNSTGNNLTPENVQKDFHNRFTRITVQNDMQSMTTGLDSTIAQLKELASNPNINDEEKEQLEEEIKKLQEMKKEIEKLQEELKSPDANVDEIKEKVDNLKKEIKDNNSELAKSVKELIAKLQDRVNGKEDSEDEDTEGTSGGNSGRTSRSSGSSRSSNGSIPATREMTSEEKANVLRTVSTIRSAIYGWGTNYDKDDNGLYNTIFDENRVNSDNIVEIFDKWNNTIGKNEKHFAKRDKGGFIESVMEDCQGKQKVEIGNRIIDLLMERAEQEGILDKVESEIMEARASLSTTFLWFRSSNKIQKAINKLVNKIKSLEKGIRADEAKKKDAEKKEAEAVKAKIVDDAQSAFYQDWKDATGQDITSMPSKIKVELENGKAVFKCRVNGKDYKASSFAELQKKLKKDNVDITTLK